MSISAGVVGLGYWGPNLARNLAASTAFNLVALCDSDPERLVRAGATYPAARCHASLDEMLAEAALDFLAIATPVATHHALALQALDTGCHILVEKPFALSSVDAMEILAKAASCGRRVFVDHTFVFTGAVQEIARQVRSGALGDLLYIDSVRVALGLFQPDVNVVWDLAPHDLSILEFVTGRAPRTVRAIGSSNNPNGLTDVAYLHLDYGAGFHAHLHLSWLSPVKIRRMFFSGSRQSLIFDDLEATEKVKLYDQGVTFDLCDAEARSRVLISYRKGGMRAPALPVAEALETQLEDIADALRQDREGLAPGRAGLSVVQTLEAASESLRREGSPVTVADVASRSGRQP